MEGSVDGKLAKDCARIVTKGRSRGSQIKEVVRITKDKGK